MKITEITRAEKYYQKNPDKLPYLGLSSPKKSDSGWDGYRSSADPRLDKITDQFKNKWLNIFGADLHKKLFSSYRNSLGATVEYALEDSKGSFDAFLKRVSDRLDLDDNDLSVIKQNYKQFYNDYVGIDKAEKGIRYSQQRKDKRRSIQSGIDPRDYAAVQDWVEHFTSMSRKKIPPEIWPALQKLTVKPSRLPKTVYRGLFVDGAKIKDKDKWLQKWAPGSKPNAKPTKIQSWSTSTGVAAEFMDAQDFIKNKEDGYAVMLKYEITDPNIVIADFRNLKDNRFWNQQEIVLSPEARDYEVVAVIPYENYFKLGKKWDETELYKFQKQHTAPGASASGISYTDAIVGYFFDINRMQIDPVEKENFRQISKMTVAQVKRDYGIRPVFIEQIEETLDQTAMPLYALVSGSYKHLSKWIISIEQATGSNSVDAYLKTDNPSGFHSTSETVKALFGKIKNFAYDDAIYLPVTITLDDNNYNNIKFSIRPTGEFFVGSYSRYSGVTSDSESKGGTAANSIIRSNPTVSAKLMQDVQSSIEDSDVNRKKNVSIEFKNNS